MRDRDWQALAEAHRQSLVEFITLAEEVPEAAWEQPLGEGQWTRSQVAEHLRLAYEVVGRELAGQTGLRVRTPGWLRPLIRLRYLGAILKQGRIPGKQRAPREINPGPGPFARKPTLAALEATSAHVEAILAERQAHKGRGLSHHIFGTMNPAKSLRFLTVHNQHHIRQLAGS